MGNHSHTDFDKMEDLTDADKVVMNLGAESPHPHGSAAVTEENLDNELPSHIHDRIMWYGIAPLSVAGFLMNGLVLWLWLQESSFRVTLTLFNTLAIADNVFLVLFNLWYFVSEDSTAAFVFKGFTFAAEHVLLNVTLVLVVCRFVQVREHSQAKEMLSEHRVKRVLGFVVIFCMLVKMLEMLVVSQSQNAETRFAARHIATHVVVTLPLLVLATFTFWLACKLCGEKVNPALPRKKPADHQSNRNINLMRQRLLTLTVLTLSLIILVTYPVSTVVYLILLPNASDFAKELMPTLVNLLHVLNSSVKLLVYLGFLSHFRSLMLIKFITLYTGNFQTLPTVNLQTKELTSGVPTLSTCKHSTEASSTHRASTDMPSSAFNLYKLPNGEWVVRERAACPGIRRSSLGSHGHHYSDISNLNPGRPSVHGQPKWNPETVQTS